MTRRALSDPGLLALYGIGACAMGGFVAVFNAVGFRLTRRPFHLGLAAAGLVFLVYPLGSVGSIVAGGWPTGSPVAPSCPSAACCSSPACC